MEHTTRYRRSWQVLRRIIKPVVKRKFRYDYEICTAEGPLLVLCNHNTDWDPLLLGVAFPEYMSFVASEHIFRWGIASRLIVWLLNPIARVKGRSALDTVITIMRRLKDGGSVAMFPEGNRSYTGQTGPIPAVTGKLVKKSRATLVTYRLDGGYLTSPRWSAGLRKGRMKGRVMHVYTPDMLKNMDAEAVNEAVRCDLFVDAYAEQRREPVRFCGKNPAEHLERVLCRCPRCRSIGTLKSLDDRLFCVCGFSVRYNEYGFFEGEDAPFDNIPDWDAAQTEALCTMADAAEGAIFTDSEMVLKEILAETHEEKELGTGTMALYRDRLECCGQAFPLGELEGFSLHGPQTVDLTCAGRSFEISSPKVRCTRKYRTVIRHFRKDLMETV